MTKIINHWERVARGKADRMLWAYVWIIAPASEPATAR